ncbi:MAG: acyl-CoA reductase [Thermoanaerobaculia bacterium]|nr:acyl-CoA reductase [Thermoanaerobaculia bacterium]
MIHDAFLPPGVAPPPTAAVERHGVLYRSAVWSGEALAAVAHALRDRGAPALAALDPARLRDAWLDTVDLFLDPASAERRALDRPLAAFCGLSPAGLRAGLEAVLGGARRGAAELIEEARPAGDGRAVLVVLAANLPGLAVQPLLPALALRRPVLLKSPSAEPLFAPAFLAALARREPALAPALAAAVWRGGDRALEDPLLAAAGRVVAYGERDSLDDLEARAAGRLFGYGPRTSLAVVAAGEDPAAVASGLARDVALFDQRGCLSVQAVYTDAPARPLADALAAELAVLAERWPPGPADPASAAGVQQLRAEAELRGLHRPPLPLAAGTVVVEPLPAFSPAPGLRSVRIHPLPDLGRLPGLLAPWRDRLQGAALAGAAAEALRPELERLGLTRFAAPGRLQHPDALWHNGGLHPLEVLAE